MLAGVEEVEEVEEVKVGPALVGLEAEGLEAEV